MVSCFSKLTRQLQVAFFETGKATL
ncbi:hypothetical protein LINPERPRIM_LOCUS30671 [Linum perenne]